MWGHGTVSVGGVASRGGHVSSRSEVTVHDGYEVAVHSRCGDQRGEGNAGTAEDQPKTGKWCIA